MKQIKKEYNAVKELFVCDICGATSENQREIKLCEKQHKCKHNKIIYSFIEADQESWVFNVRGITTKCQDCGKYLVDIDFQNIEHDQKKLQSIFELCGGKLNVKS